jgi:putative phosphoribosyl transferase
VPETPTGIVIFAHGSGSGRTSPRNNQVAAGLHEAGLATLLLDLVTPEEAHDRRNVFDIPLLAARLAEAADWTRSQPDLATLQLGYFGASTGAAAKGRTLRRWFRAAVARISPARRCTPSGRPHS